MSREVDGLEMGPQPNSFNLTCPKCMTTRDCSSITLITTTIVGSGVLVAAIARYPVSRQNGTVLAIRNGLLAAFIGVRGLDVAR